jgi:hypothetical protein
MKAEGGRAAASLWARADLRRRWRSLVVLGVLAGITAGAAMSAFAGARRTATALPRLRQDTAAPSAIVFASQSGVFHPDFARLRAQPEVADLGVWDLVDGSIDGEPGATLFASDDGRWGRDVNRPVLVAGRMWDPTAPNEVVVDENAAKQGVALGTTHQFAMIGPTLQDLIAGRTNGPKATLKVVGVVRDVNQFLFVTDGQAFLGPAFVRRYRGLTTLHPNADVILRKPGPSAVAALRRDVDHIVGPGTPTLDLHSVERRVDTTVSVERTALLLLAAAIAVAGGLLVTQALSRSAAVIGDDAYVLRSMGMSRRQIAGAAAISHLLSAFVAAVVAFATAMLASRWFPVGLSRRIDPDVGTHVDWTVIAPGLALTLLLVLAGTVLVAARASSPRPSDETVQPRTLMTRVRRWAPLSIGLGATMAFERGKGRTSIPVAPALIGAVVGVLGVVGALTIDHGLHDALAHPERAGVTWDVTISPPEHDVTTTGIKAGFAATVRRATGGAMASIDRQLVPINGVGVPTFTIRPIHGARAAPIAFELVRGHAPRADGEAVIGPATAKDVGAKLGDTIRVGPRHVPLRVVGEGLFPSDVHAEFDEGVWVTPSQLDRIVPADPTGHGRVLAVRLPPGAHRSTALTSLQRVLPRNTDVSQAEVPVELTNLRNVRTLPILLAGFLALLAIGALSHVLITSSFRRRHDFAVLRALGLDRRRTRLVLNSQGTAIGLVGLIIGLPVGVALGRVAWRLVTDQVPLANVAPFALTAVLLIVPITVIVVNVLALWPGRRLARLRAAEVLRTE